MKKEEEEKKKEEWDLLNKKLGEYNLSSQEKESIKQDILHKEAEILRHT